LLKNLSVRAVERRILFQTLMLGILVVICLPHHGVGAGVKHSLTRRINSGSIDQEKGARILREFRHQRLTGDFSFKFELRHMPRRGQDFAYQGQIWGTWNDQGLLSRLQVNSDDERTPVLSLLTQNGQHPQVWKYVSDDPSAPHTETGDMMDQSPARRLNETEIFDPILPGLVYTVFDLQMPFIYWTDYSFEGKGRAKGRNVYTYLMRPPSDLVAKIPELGAVRMSLDAQFKALVKAEVLDHQGKIMKTFKIMSFKKVQGQYILKKVDGLGRLIFFHRSKALFTKFFSSCDWRYKQ